MTSAREEFWLKVGVAALAALMFAGLLVSGLLGGGSFVPAALLALAGVVVIVGTAVGWSLLLAWCVSGRKRVSRPKRKSDGEWVTEIDDLSVRIAELSGVPPELGPLPRSSISNLNGVPWHQAPVPRRLHRCTPQTKGYINYFTTVQRCACGAIRSQEGDSWRERNSREMADGRPEPTRRESRP